MALTTASFKKFGETLSDLLRPYNYQVASTAIAGKPGRANKNEREFRLQLINKANDTSDSLVKNLQKVIEDHIESAKDIKYNSVSPNSSKFPSYSFEAMDQKFDLVIARGANKGENFETSTVANLSKAFGGSSNKDPKLIDLLEKMGEVNKAFASVEIKKVEQRKGSTKKTGVPIEDLGAVIGDIILTDTSNKPWYISLKDINGMTFSAYPGAGSLFDKDGNLQPTSEGAKFLQAFGVDINKVQQGFDERSNIKKVRTEYPLVRASNTKLSTILQQAWGMNYFYVRKTSTSWEVFWIDKAKLDKLSNVKVDKITYPSKTTKSVTIFCSSPIKKYKIEMRNSAGGFYPNDIKFAVVK